MKSASPQVAERLRLMLIEDDDLHRDFLRKVALRQLPEGSEISEFDNGASAIAAANEWKPHGLVIDLQLPAANGIEVARAIWRGAPETRILFWSNYADEAYVRSVSRIVPAEAVYGYVLKSASEERLRFAIQGVFLGDQCIVDREIRSVQHRSENRGEGLTDAEFEILTDVALGLTDKGIAVRHGISLRTVQARLQNLYHKLGIEHSGPETEHIYNSRTRAIFVALGRGLINPEALLRAGRRFEDWLAERNMRQM